MTDPFTRWFNRTTRCPNGYHRSVLLEDPKRTAWGQAYYEWALVCLDCQRREWLGFVWSGVTNQPRRAA